MSAPAAAMTPRVTAVLVCWNHVRYVRAAIESVLQQTYPNIQLIVFDNGSTDGSRRELVREAKRGLAIIVPSVALVSVAIWLLRDLVIHILFTAEFAAMRDLFGWQMLGNTLKMVGWLFGYLLLAKANALAMAALEIVTIVVWWLLSLAFIAHNGTIGAPQAYVATYALYAVATFVGVAFVVRRMRAAPRAAVA